MICDDSLETKNVGGKMKINRMASFIEEPSSIDRKNRRKSFFPLVRHLLYVACDISLEGTSKVNLFSN